MPKEKSEEQNSFDFTAFLNTYEGHINQVNNLIVDQISHSKVPLVAEVSTHLIQAGGKRLRPLLVLACNNITGEMNEDSIIFAAAIELIHTATLLHDDVIDGGQKRRGKDTAAVIWGNKTSILAGDYLLSKAFECALKTRYYDGLDLLSRTTSQIAEGEILQLSFANKFDINIDDCLDIMKAKTAVLFGASCQLGAMCGDNLNNEQSQALYNFGMNLGISFQITDDLLDYTGSEEHFGKTPGNDLSQKNLTMPAIIAHLEAIDDQPFWQRIFSDEYIYNEADLVLAKKSIIDSNSGEKCLQLAKRHTNIALEALDTLPDSDLKIQLHQLAIELTDRSV